MTEPFAQDMELWFREFSKSLIDRTYTWYPNSKPGSIEDWEHLVKMFNAKFFSGEAKFPLAELGWTQQFSDEDLVYTSRDFIREL